MQSAVFILVTKIKAQQFSILHDRCAFCTNIIRTKFTVNHEIWLPQHDKTGILNNLQIVYKILRLIWLPSYTGHAIINKILVSLFLNFFFVLFSLCKAWRGNEVVKKCSKTGTQSGLLASSKNHYLLLDQFCPATLLGFSSDSLEKMAKSAASSNKEGVYLKILWLPWLEKASIKSLLPRCCCLTDTGSSGDENEL